jgi:hypothetical protein
LFPADTTNYTDASVRSGTNYEYRIQATNAWGVSPYSVQQVTVPLPSPPLPPSLVEAWAISAEHIEVTWAAVAGAQGYRLERRTDSPQSWKPLAMLPPDLRSYQDTNVIVGTEYWYRVFAFNTVGDSPSSMTPSAIALNIDCILSDQFDSDPNSMVWAEISGGKAIDGGKGFLEGKALWFGANTMRFATTIPVPISIGASLNFKMRAGNQDVDDGTYWDNSETNESVVVEFSVDGLSWLQIQPINTVYPALSTWKDFSIPVPAMAASPHTQFRWRQLKNSGAGYDAWALDNICIRTPLPATLSAPPFILAAANSATSVALLWFASPGAAYYIVERQSEGQTWTQVGMTPSGVTFFTDSKVMSSTAYSYRVKAATTVTQSPYSSVASVTTPSQVTGWLQDNLGNGNLAITTTGADGVPYIIRYAYNLDASEPLSVLGEADPDRGLPRFWLDPTTQRLAVEFVRRDESTRPGIVYAVQFSGDLIQWKTQPTTTSVNRLDPVWERVRFVDASDTSSGGPRFARVVVQPAVPQPGN